MQSLHQLTDRALEDLALFFAEELGIIALLAGHDVPTVEQVGDHVGVLQTRIFRLDVEEHASTNENSC